MPALLRTLIASAVISFLGITSTLAQETTYFIDESRLPFSALPGTNTTRYWGVLDGAGYRVEVPDNWNGDLVLYAHGFRGYPRGYLPGDPPDAGALELTVSNPTNLRQYLVTNGFAWAASSYSTNGYDVAQGVKDTHALGKFFNELVKKPRRLFIAGHSMGGHVTTVAIEQYPKEYVGALPMCGVNGDIVHFDRRLGFHMVAHTLAGIDAQFPQPANYYTEFVPAMKSQYYLPGFPGNPTALSTKGLKLRDVVEQMSGGTRPGFAGSFANWADFMFSRGYEDGTLRGLLPGNGTTNVGLIYQVDADPALTVEETAINQTVLRVSADPQARPSSGLNKVPRVDGTPRIPVVTLHTLGDLFVWFLNQQIYAQRVAANGKSDLLVSRAIRAVGHCGFNAAEEVAAFRDLVNWVNNPANKPAGDDILDPATVAQPNFGCAFSTSKRPQFDACPVPN